jgi:hypothetical protein
MKLSDFEQEEYSFYFGNINALTISEIKKNALNIFYNGRFLRFVNYRIID